ncbi:hypothetical protein CARUB_v10017810mg [Capsella rubella]|uniref:MATH domain-containing protein n=1 Tax=Capsella rubella TaxID=81985 RepID=R0HL04_9BRAS|nr:hypothetical protein CARUB_v10017810mg [Capsella rubella]
MGKQLDKKKITWTIKNFSSLPAGVIYSDPFVVGGCKWHLQAYPKGYNNVNSLSLFLGVHNCTSLPLGWRRHAKFRLSIVNHLSDKLSQSKLKDSGFLLNGQVKVVVEIDVLETIGKVDVTEETSTITEIVDVNGFQLLPSQAKSVRCMFERHPDIASDFRPKNPILRTGYMSLLLSLVETMRQLPQDISKDDLFDAYAALGTMKDAGFKLDWLENKLHQVSEKKENEEASETVLQEMEEELKDMKQKCSDMEALLEKEKAKVSSSKAPISFDDIV